MIKKINLIAVAVAVAALAMPAVASAGRITKPLEVMAPVGTLMTVKSTNLSINMSIGTIKCKEIVFPGEITENAGGNYNVIGTAEGSATSCSVGKFAAFPTNLRLFGFGVNVEQHRINLTLKFDLPGSLTCHFETKPAPGFLEFVNGLQRPEFGIPLQALQAESELCEPAEKPAEIEGNFQIEETGGGVLLLD